MDTESIEQKIQEIQEQTRKLIDDIYVIGYKDGYLECMKHKMIAKDESFWVTDNKPIRLEISDVEGRTV